MLVQDFTRQLCVIRSKEEGSEKFFYEARKRLGVHVC